MYKVTNNITKECYIGASKNIMNRWRDHFSNYKNPNRKDYNSLLYINIRKFGLENFKFELLEECDILELNDKERYYVKLFKPEYNQTPGGKGGHVNKPKRFKEIIYDLEHSNKTFKEIGKEYGYCECTISQINKGESWYDENLNYPIRTLDRKKIALNKTSIRILQFDKKGNFIQEWESIRAFYISQGEKRDTFHIGDVCKGKRKTACGYIWKYKEDYEKNKA